MAKKKQASPVLEVEGLRTHFFTEEGVVKAVDGVSYSLAPGEVLGIVGESGSGKSVMGMSMLRLIPDPPGRIVSGKITLQREGKPALDLVQATEREMQRVRGKDVAMIFQDPMTSLNPYMTVGRQLSEVLELHEGSSKKEARSRSIEMLAEVGIPDPSRRFDDHPHQLSGGMRQRVMIAMALLGKPRVLIADEPTTALDVTIQAQILELLIETKEKLGTAIILITHDLGVVARIADRVAVMYAGRIVEEGTAEEIFHDPRHPYAVGLARSIPRLDAQRGSKLVPIPGMPSSLAKLPSGCPFRLRCPNALEVCSQVYPEEREVSPGHRAFCHETDAVKVKSSEVDGKSSVFREMDSSREETSKEDAPVLVVDDLAVHFPVRRGLLMREVGKVKAVDGVSLRLERGKTLGLVGESGCGKSTTGRAILRLIEPTRGSVVIDGADVLRLSRRALVDARRQMQMVFQDPYASLNGRMTVFDTLAEPFRVHRAIEASGSAGKKELTDRVAALMSKTGLDPMYMRRYPHEFSGGQRQRIGIARAIALDPKLVVLDEPVSALDVSIQAQIINLLMELQDKLKMSYLFVAHDLAVVKHISQEVAVMYLGRVVERAETETLFREPKHPYTKALLSAIPVADPKVEKKRQRLVLVGDVPSPLSPPSGCTFHTRCPIAEDRCKETSPTLVDRSSDGGSQHMVACHLVDKS